MTDLSKPVETRDGRKVRVLTTEVNSPKYSVAAVVTEKDGTEGVHTYTMDGFYYEDKEVDALDLVNVPNKRTVYVNVYSSPIGLIIGSGYNTIADAVDAGTSEVPVGRVKIELVEGRFDD